MRLWCARKVPQSAAIDPFLGDIISDNPQIALRGVPFTIVDRLGQYTTDIPCHEPKEMLWEMAVIGSVFPIYDGLNLYALTMWQRSLAASSRCQGSP